MGWERGREYEYRPENRINIPVYAKEATEYLFSLSFSQPRADGSEYVTGLQSISSWVGIQGRAIGGWKRPSSWDLRASDMLFHFAYCPSPGKDTDPPALWILHPCGKSRQLLR